MILLLFIGIAWYYGFFFSTDDTSDNAIRDTSRIYLKELAEQKENQVQINIEGQTRQLQVTAETLQMITFEEESEMKEYLSAMKVAGEFDFLGIVDSTGIVHTPEKCFSGISRFSFISKELTGPSVEFNNSLDNMNLVMAVIPLENCKMGNLELTAMISGTHTKAAAELISLFDEDAQTFSEVVMNNGAYIMQGPKDHIGSGSNFLSAMKKKAEFDEGYSYEEMESAMAEGEAIFVSYNVDDLKYFTYLTPIIGTDWYMVSTIHYNAVSDGVNSVRTTLMRNSIVLLAFVILVFVGAFSAYFTIQKRQAAILLARVKAEESNRAKSVFLSQMSHDIRTPMNAIVGFTNLALKQKNVPAEVHEYHLKIRTASNHLLMLINEVLDMSRIESGKLELDENICSLSSLLVDLEAVMGKQAEDKKQNLQIEYRISDDYVYCDKLRLNQVLQNLVGNAIKYTPAKGQIQVNIWQKIDAEGSYGEYQIIVADNGRGMSEEFAQKVFEPFERERNSTISGIEGTGLGLPIAKSIIDAMGGEIKVQTAPNEGTTFAIFLKLRLAEENRIQGMEQAKKEREANSDMSQEAMKGFFAGKRVLLVEDNDFNREIAQEILEEVGLVVELVPNGSKAVDRVQEVDAHYYDVILMDIQMPVMNGYDATRAIRTLEGDRSKVKIIAVTANAFDSDRQDAYEAGMDAHVSKPIDVEELYSVMRKVM